MATYLQQLNQYNRYQRMIPTIKSAELTDARSWWGLGGKTGAQYFTEDNEGWSNEEAFRTLLGTLPPEVQQEYVTSGAAQNINGLFAQALANPQKYSNLLTYAAQDQQLALQGKRSALSTVLEQNPFAKQVVSQIKDGVQNNINNGKGLRGTITRFGHNTGFAATKDQIGNAPVEEVQKYMNGTAPQQGQPQQAPAQAPSEQTPAAQAGGAQAGGAQQNPSMWNYMLPALMLGGPMALLGGLGGGKGMGLGLLGLAGLGGLGYGYARSQGWEGFSPIENMANMMNGWFGMGGQQNAQGQQPGATTPAQTTPQAGGQPAATQAPAQPQPPAYMKGITEKGKDKNGNMEYWAESGSIPGYKDNGGKTRVYYDPKKQSYMASDWGWDSRLDNFTPYDTSAPTAPSTPSTNTAMSATGTPGTGSAAWNSNTNQASPGAGTAGTPNTAATTFGAPKQNK